MDPFPGLFKSPGSLHRYTYATANPLNVIDSSGAIASNVLGIYIHFHIRSMHPGPLLPGAIPGVTPTLIPDLADLKKKEVMEIKPLSSYGLAGWSQLDGYINALNTIGKALPFVGIGWHAGTWSPPSGAYVEPRSSIPYIVVGNAAGVVFYWIPRRRVPQRVWKKIAEAVREFNKQVAARSLAELALLGRTLESLVLDDLVVASLQVAAAATVVAGAGLVMRSQLAVVTARFAF